MFKLFNNHQTQTEFNAEEQFREGDTPIYQDPPVSMEAKPNPRKKLYLWGGIGGGAFLLILIILIVVVNSRGQEVVEQPPEQEEVVVPVSNDKVTRAIQQLKADLVLADPSVQIFTFPPLLIEARIDEK